MGLKDETQKLHIADLTIKNRQPLVYFFLLPVQLPEKS